jgi:hypothetical protein
MTLGGNSRVQEVAAALIGSSAFATGALAGWTRGAAVAAGGLAGAALAGISAGLGWAADIIRSAASATELATEFARGASARLA